MKRLVVSSCVFALPLIGGIAVPMNAHAWGDEGHQIVGKIADNYLDPAVRTKVNQLLAGDTTGLVSGTDIANEATWADHFRDSDRPNGPHYTKTHEWHFVDIELDGSANLDAACFGHPPVPAGTVASDGPNNDCVVDKINEFTAELQAPGTTDAERRMALQFLLHFVGDLHQPLHSSDAHDLGGNSKSVTATGFPSGKLHHFWDTEFVQRIGTDPATVAQQLIGQITPAQASAWAQGSVESWAQESFGVARDQVYGPLPAPVSGKYALPQTYVDNAVQVATVQLQKAGIRLATVLNQALGGPVTGTCTDAARASALPTFGVIAGITISSSGTTTILNTATTRFFFTSTLSQDPTDPSGTAVALQNVLRQAGWRATAASSSNTLYSSSWTVQVAGCGTLGGVLVIVPRPDGQAYYGEIEVVQFP